MPKLLESDQNLGWAIGGGASVVKPRETQSRHAWYQVKQSMPEA
jgi:hypothetical protein